MTAGTDRFATDRVTAVAVNDEKYVGVGAEPHEGLVNKFPFDVEQKTYPIWDGLLGRAVEATFVRARRTSTGWPPTSSRSASSTSRPRSATASPARTRATR